MTTPVYKEKNIIYFPEDGVIIEIDCLENLNYSKKITTTKHKVEKGLPITDHTVVQNFTFSITGIIASAYVGKESAPIEIESKLDFYCEKRAKVIVVTKQKTYENIVIVGFNKSLSPDNSDDLDFTLEFEEIRTANTKTILKPVKTNIGKDKKELSKKDNEAQKKDYQNRHQQQINKGKQAQKFLDDAKKKQANNVKNMKSSKIPIPADIDSFGGILK